MVLLTSALHLPAHTYDTHTNANLRRETKRKKSIKGTVKEEGEEEEEGEKKKT